VAQKVDRVKAAKLKLARAAKHLKAIQRCISKYSSGGSYEILPGKTKGKKTTQVKVRKVPPPEISILSGEMIYQMRSALDHLAFGLVERNVNSVALPPRWDERCQFPLLDKIPKDNTGTAYKLPVPHSVFSKDLPGVRAKVLTFIESLQPYYRAGTVNNVLGFLAKLSNIDKHRYLNIIGVRISRRQKITYASGLSLEGFDTFDHGARFQTEPRSKPDRPVFVYRHYGVPVHFDELKLSGTPLTFPVDYVLKLMLKQIETVIVPQFDKFINHP
jgi:hypothetical protein